LNLITTCFVFRLFSVYFLSFCSYMLTFPVVVWRRGGVRTGQVSRFSNVPGPGTCILCFRTSLPSGAYPARACHKPPFYIQSCPVHVAVMFACEHTRGKIHRCICVGAGESLSQRLAHVAAPNATLTHDKCQAQQCDDLPN
jgi:hypothetical protein